MRVRNREEYDQRREQIMKTCFNCYAENGLSVIGIKTVAEACGCTSGSLYTYFENLDDLIIQSTAYCMGKIADDFMKQRPKNREDLPRFIETLPRWAARKYAPQLRLLHQIYTLPKYAQEGRKFFDDVNLRYGKYATSLSKKLDIPVGDLLPLVIMLVRVSVQFALFGDEYTLVIQLETLKKSAVRYLQERPDCN